MLVQKFNERALIGAFCVLLVGVLMGAACGGGAATSSTTGATSTNATSSGGPSGAGGATTGTANTSSSTMTGSGGSSSCTHANCDDGCPCTIDNCVGNSCTHTIGPNTGATACAEKTYCVVGKCCIDAPACATDAQCQDLWKNDACKAKVKCDPASSVCTFEILDKDGDGYPPQVCGGGDCDDSDPLVHPGAKEYCNGKDDNCDGLIDNAATCGALEACTAGKCECMPQYACNGSCTDKVSDLQNCGACGVVCGIGFMCVAGTCVCPEAVCGGACVSVKSDQTNCGACGKVCAAGAACDQGACTCPAGEFDCGAVCSDTVSDLNNCGGCGKACPNPSTYCEAGECRCFGAGFVCNGKCVDKANDEQNCGACGNACGAGAGCAKGACSCVPALPDLCGNTCVDTQSDAMNCGACGNVCPAGAECHNWMCGIAPGGACNWGSMVECSDYGWCDASSCFKYYCNTKACGAGTCEVAVIPSGAKVTSPAPVCGCNNVTYWDATSAAYGRVPVAHTGPCTPGVVCGTGQPACPAGSVCELKVANAAACSSPNIVGTCWNVHHGVTPIDGNVDRAMMCTDKNVCLSEWKAVGTGAYYINPTCNPGSCYSANDCPAAANECAMPACIDEWCDSAPAKSDGTVTTAQTPGDCKQNQCLGAGIIAVPDSNDIPPQVAGDCKQAGCDNSGNIVSSVNDADIPDDGDPCTIDWCKQGVPMHDWSFIGTSCNKNGGKVCDAMGKCVQCVVGGNCASGTCVMNKCQ